MRPKKRILLVNADEAELGVMRLVFETQGFAVRAESAPVAAYEEARLWRPEVLVMHYAPADIAVQIGLADAVKRAVPGVSLLVLVPDAERIQVDIRLGADFVLVGAHCAPALVIEAAKRMSARKRGPRKGSRSVSAHMAPALTVDDLVDGIARRAPRSETVVWARKAKVA